MAKTILFPFFAALVATYAVVPLVIALAWKCGFVDDPDKRVHPAHTHRGIIPRAGGLALLIGISTASFIFLPTYRLFVGTFVASLILVCVGLADDRWDINPYIRLVTNALAVAIVIASGVTIPFITNPATGGVLRLDTTIITVPLLSNLPLFTLSTALTFLWLFWMVSIVGWSAGVDGQMPGFVAIAAAVLGILSLRYSIADPAQIPVTIFAFIVSGAFSGFIPWNFFPQKIMPGYGGKTLAGFLLGLLAILSYGKLGTALLVLGIPTVDAVYTLIRRIIRKRSPVWADGEHLHHELLRLGWGRRKIALFYWFVSAILGAVALSVKSQQKIFALFLVAVSLGGFFLWVKFFSQFSKPPVRDSG